MHVMVDGLAPNSTQRGRRRGRASIGPGVLELRCLGFESSFGLCGIVVLELAVLGFGLLLHVHGGLYLTLREGLDGGVVVILVSFLVDDVLNSLLLPL